MENVLYLPVIIIFFYVCTVGVSSVNNEELSLSRIQRQFESLKHYQIA